MESTIIATIHCPDVGYCLFGNPRVMHIPYHVPCIFLIVIVSYLGSTFLSSLISTPHSLYPIRILYGSYYVLLD